MESRQADEGTELDLSAEDPGDELDDAERARLHASIDRGLADAAAGRAIPADELVAELKLKR